MMCERCNKRDAINVVGGRRLCSICSKDEITKRIKRELYPRKIIVHDDKILFAYPSYLSFIQEILRNIINKIYTRFNLQYYEINLEPQNSILDDIWNLIIKSKQFSEKNGINKIFLPFTADFLMAYLIYSITNQDYTYIQMIGLEYKVNNISFLIPFYNTSLYELQGFINNESNAILTKDEIFNEILTWERDMLKENYELFHAFHNSKKLLETGRKDYRCEGCGGVINSPVKYCARCSLIYSSPPY
ncbi:MAG: hypothetical protein QXY87_04255 [Saccharolobus sp.]|uniref:hypothetical protein n=1 Tax=Saccharolobus TaxID=2100760 RepID=UPI001C46CD2F|nr:hypothetical protein [Saccharolobus shibatae]MCH4815007.1 hypothetical protein [Saccharolobus shibatae]